MVFSLPYHTASAHLRECGLAGGLSPHADHAHPRKGARAAGIPAPGAACMPRPLRCRTWGGNRMRIRKTVAYDDVRIDTIIEGEGRPLVLLPSSSRDSEDF